MRILRLVLLSFACAGLPLAAQPSAQPPATFRLLAVHSGGDGVADSSGLYYEPSSKSAPVPVSMGGNLSRPYARPASSQLVFFQEIPPPPDAPAKTSPIRRPRLSVTLPPDNQPCLIVVTAAPPGSPLPLVGRVFRNDATEHPASSLRIINLSPHPAAASIDSRNHEVPAYAGSVVPLSPPETGNTKFLRFKFGSKQGGGWSLIHDESFRYRPDYRMYAIILNARTKDEERVKIFSERPPSPPAQR